MGGFKLKQELMTSPVTTIEKFNGKTKLPEGKPYGHDQTDDSAVSSISPATLLMIIWS
jgi:hypothetical protein